MRATKVGHGAQSDETRTGAGCTKRFRDPSFLAALGMRAIRGRIARRLPCVDTDQNLAAQVTHSSCTRDAGA